MKPYTYLIKFKQTGQVYYGSRSKNIRLSLEPEQDLMIRYFTSCKTLRKLIKLHGLSAFEWEVRRVFDTIEQSIAWEQKVLRRMKVLHDPKWFNQNVAGYIVPTVAGLKKISERHKGVPKSDAHRKAISRALKGKKKSPKHVENLSKAHKGQIPYNKGIPATEDRKNKQRKAMKGKKPWNTGKKLLEWVKDKISQTKKNTVYTEEQKEKFRKAQLLARKDKTLTEESKDKIRDGVKKYWEKKKEQS